MTTPLEAELEQLRQRLQLLEAERLEAQQHRRRSRRLTLGALALTALASTAGLAANGACPNGLPYCFVADTPASAAEVNTNFAQLKEWLEQKVGATGSANVRMQAGTTSNVATAAGKALFVSGVWGDGASNNGGVEFRHDNLTEGIGFGHNTIYATGSNANQPLQLKARGTGTVNFLSPTVATATFAVSGALSANGGLTASSATVNGDLVVPNNSHGDCYETAYACGWIYCNAGYYMTGLDIAENENCGGNGDFDFSPFALRCCKL